MFINTDSMKYCFSYCLQGFMGSSACGEKIFDNKKKVNVHIGEKMNRRIDRCFILLIYITEISALNAFSAYSFPAVL